MNHPPLSSSATPGPATDIRDEALAWFVRRNNEAFSADEEYAFQIWLNADPARQAAMAYWQAEWQTFDLIPTETKQRLQSELAIAKAKESAKFTPLPILPKSLPRRRAWIPAFAVVLLAVTLGTGLTVWNNWQGQPVYEQSFNTARGQQVEATLPDGSRLQMDAATRLHVIYYRHRREVILNDGQAVFSVQSDSAKPFHVMAGQVRVTVVGTRFMVRHLPKMSADPVQVAVEQGRVQVERVPGDQTILSSAANHEMVILGAGQQVTGDIQGRLTAITQVPTASFALWRDNRVRFDNTRLDQAVAELARYSDPQLVLRDPAAAALRVTGVFDPRDPATFKRVLPFSLPVQLREDKGLTEIVLAR